MNVSFPNLGLLPVLMRAQTSSQNLLVRLGSVVVRRTGSGFKSDGLKEWLRGGQAADYCKWHSHKDSTELSGFVLLQISYSIYPALIYPSRHFSVFLWEKWNQFKIILL